MASEEEMATVPDAENTLGGVKNDTDPPHPNVIVAIVKSLMPGQDLTRVTIPPFYLEPRSLLERWADVLMHPQLLHGVCRLPTPEERILAVTRWFLSGWHYRTVGVKKPFNPIVGETFACQWRDGTQYVAEQVLHRPPISAVYFENKEHCYRANAHIWTKGTFQFPQSSKSALDGGCIFTLTNLDEEYWISFPTFYAHNLLLGQLRMEVGDQGVVLCKKTGLRAEVNFQQISMFGSATLNSVEGRVFAEGAGGKKIASIRGHWDKVLFITPEGGAEAPWLDLAATPVMPKLVLPLEAQGPWESRRLWRYCSEELQQRPEVNWAAVDREKGQLEEEQRVLPCHAKHGSAEYKDWQAKVFKPKVVTDPLTGKERQFHFFSGAEEGKALNVLSLSRSLADPRGGLGEAGAVPELVARTHAITLSARRCAERGGSGAAGAGAGAAASGAGAAAPGGAHAASSSSSSGGGGGGGGGGSGSSGSQGSS